MKKECKDFSESKINQYIDGELDDEKRDLLEQHLSQCEYCRSYAEDLKNTLSFISIKHQPEVPRSVWNKIKEATAEKEPFFRLVPGMAFVSAVLILMIIAIYPSYISKKEYSNGISEYIESEISYLHEDTLINEWYLQEEEGEEINIDSYLIEEL
ncbi:anti-sigma factor family protein [Elusimicrobiota bacterium]